MLASGIGWNKVIGAGWNGTIVDELLDYLCTRDDVKSVVAEHLLKKVSHFDDLVSAEASGKPFQ